MSRTTTLKAEVGEKSLKKLKQMLEADAHRILANATAASVEEVAKKAESLARQTVANYPFKGDTVGSMPTVSRTETQYISDTDCQAEVRLNGENAVFFEFGAGQYYNVPVGSTEHPKGAALGYTIGSYPGQTHAGEDEWYLPDGLKTHSGLRYTHGTKAVMPLHNAAETLKEELQ